MVEHYNSWLLEKHSSNEISAQPPGVCQFVHRQMLLEGWLGVSLPPGLWVAVPQRLASGGIT